VREPTRQCSFEVILRWIVEPLQNAFVTKPLHQTVHSAHIIQYRRKIMSRNVLVLRYASADEETLPRMMTVHSYCKLRRSAGRATAFTQRIRQGCSFFSIIERWNFNQLEVSLIVGLGHDLPR
jgi:hypothetical protein